MQLLGDVEMPQTCYAFRIPSGAVQAIGPLIIGSWEVSPLPIVAVGSTMNDVPITSTPGRRSTCCTMRDLTRPCTVLVMNGELAHPQKKQNPVPSGSLQFIRLPKFKLNLLERSQCETKPMIRPWETKMAKFNCFFCFCFFFYYKICSRSWVDAFKLTRSQ